MRPARPGRVKTALVAAVGSMSLLLAGCTGTESSAESTTADGMISYLNYGDFGGGTAPQENYNPYLSAFRLSGTSYIYESLMYIETYGCDAMPWLADSYEWKDTRTLVYDIRDGVAWNDGESFTAEDVEFSFNLLKEHDVLDEGGIWAHLESVTANGDDQVTIKFKEPGTSLFTQVSSILIVPEHVWSKVKDPETFTNADNPVGTGPMMLKDFSQQQLVIERNPSYWQADKIRVKEIRFNKSDAGGPVEQLKLSRGEYDSHGMFIPDIEKGYVNRDPKHHHYWYAPGMLISVYMNLTKAPFDDVEFRRALTSAFDYNKVVEKAQLGYVKQASQSGLVVPGEAEWLPEDVEDMGRMTFDPAAADRALTEAGYVKDDQGRRLDKNGNPISFTFKVPGEYVDWVAASDILIENLNALGLQVEQETPTPESHDEDRLNGNYDMMFGVHGGGCSVYHNFGDPLDSTHTAPVGQPALTNEIRWRDPETDALLRELRVAPNEAAQQEAVHGLVDVMMNDVPMIPIWYGAKWFQYDTTKAVGWPNAQDPYADGGNGLVVLTHLRPAGKSS
jgi:peptide/nickel transport system substrate-binding protein